MSNKIKVMIAIVAMLNFAGISLGYTYSWCYTSGNWADPAIWDAMPSPTLTGMALIYNGAVVNVTTNGQGTVDLALGYAGGNEMGATVNVAQGIEWDVAGSGIMGHGSTGVLNVYGTADFAGLRMSTSATSSSTINVYNGGLLKVGIGGWAINVGEAGPASINLKGNGCMEIGGDGNFHLVMNGLGQIDIEAGQMKVLGDMRTQLQGYINNGWITSRGGSSRCSLEVSYLDGFTYVKTIGCTCATYLPADLNHDCYVDIADVAFLAQNWLNCTVSMDPDCTL